MVLVPIPVRKKVYSPASSVPPSCHLTFCTSTKSNLHFGSCFHAVTGEPAQYKLFAFHVSSLISYSVA
jgi:hypothetical protein